MHHAENLQLWETFALLHTYSHSTYLYLRAFLIFTHWMFSSLRLLWQADWSGRELIRRQAAPTLEPHLLRGQIIRWDAQSWRLHPLSSGKECSVCSICSSLLLWAAQPIHLLSVPPCISPSECFSCMSLLAMHSKSKANWNSSWTLTSFFRGKEDLLKKWKAFLSWISWTQPRTRTFLQSVYHQLKNKYKISW